MTRCPIDGKRVVQDSPGGTKKIYCSDRCKRVAVRRRKYNRDSRSLGLFVPGIMKKTKEHKREWGYT